MTIGISVLCNDGIVVASDSLATFGRGVSVSKFVEKIHIIEHDNLLHPVTIVGAGMMAHVDKFVDRVKRKAINDAVYEMYSADRELYKAMGMNVGDIKLDIVDFAERVCETLVTMMFKEYAIDRPKLLGIPSRDWSINLIIAGVSRDNEYRAFFVHQDGITENISDYGTIGSGAAYAELFLRELSFRRRSDITTKLAASFAVYAVKGAELMDPNVGGLANVFIIKLNSSDDDDDKGVVEVSQFEEAEQFDAEATDKIKTLLKEMGDRMGKLASQDKDNLIESATNLSREGRKVDLGKPASVGVTNHKPKPANKDDGKRKKRK